MTKPVTDVEYDAIECSYNKEAVCPYCMRENKLEYEDFGENGEKQTALCNWCDKTFVYITNNAVTFDTKPYENDYLYTKNRLTRIIKRYTETDAVSHRQTIKALSEELENLENEMMDLMPHQ